MLAFGITLTAKLLTVIFTMMRTTNVVRLVTAIGVAVSTLLLRDGINTQDKTQLTG